MKRYLAILILLALAVSSSAKEYPLTWQQELVKQTAEKLHYPDGWKFIVAGPILWDNMVSRYDLNTKIAFTFPNLRTTVIRESFVTETGRPYLEYVMAHELGHVQCKCSDEHEADKRADKILEAAKRK